MSRLELMASLMSCSSHGRDTYGLPPRGDAVPVADGGDDAADAMSCALTVAEDGRRPFADTDDDSVSASGGSEEDGMERGGSAGSALEPVAAPALVPTDDAVNGVALPCTLIGVRAPAPVSVDEVDDAGDRAAAGGSIEAVMLVRFAGSVDGPAASEGGAATSASGGGRGTGDGAADEEITGD